ERRVPGRRRNDVRAQAPTRRRGIVTKVLVIDDEAVVREVIEAMLSGSGYEVVCASTAAAALELFADESIRLVITEVFMPEGSGFGLGRPRVGAGRRDAHPAAEPADRPRHGRHDARRPERGPGARRGRLRCETVHAHGARAGDHEGARPGRPQRAGPPRAVAGSHADERAGE